MWLFIYGDKAAFGAIHAKSFAIFKVHDFIVRCNNFCYVFIGIKCVINKQEGAKE